MKKEYDDSYDKEIQELVKYYENACQTSGTPYLDVEDFIDLINYYMSNGVDEKAIDVCNRALVVYPNDADISLKLAQIYAFRGDVDNCEDILGPIESLHTDNYELYLTKMLVELQLRNITKAKIHAKKALKLGKRSNQDEYLDLIISIGEAFEDNMYIDEAFEIYKSAFNDFKNENELLLRMGDNRCHSGKIEECFDYYKAALDIDPFQTNVWFNIGLTYNLMQEYERAIEAYDYAIAIDPSLSEAIFNKGNALCALEHYTEAIECYTEHLTANPQNPIAKCYIGDSYLKMEEIDTAEKYFLEANQIQPTAEAYVGLASISIYRGQDQEALEYSQMALEIAPEMESAVFVNAQAMSLTGDFEAAIRTYKQLLNNKKDDIKTHLLYIFALLIAEQFDNAFEAANNALEMFPEHAQLQYIISALLYKRGEIEKSFELFETAYSQAPEFDNVYFEIVPSNKKLAEIKEIRKRLKPKGRRKK